MKEIGDIIKCVKDIEELARPLLERSWRRILKRKTRIMTRHGVTMHEHYGNSKFQQ
jgi:hypothetical protein